MSNHPRCIVNNCPTGEKLKESEQNPLATTQQLYSFPSSSVRQKWCEQLKLQLTDLKARAYVCSEHFSHEMLAETIISGGVVHRMLKETAYPDISLPIEPGPKLRGRARRPRRVPYKIVPPEAEKDKITAQPIEIEKPPTPTPTYSNRCRICLDTIELESLDAGLVSTFEALTSFKIVFDQGTHLPQHICVSCKGLMHAAQTFVDRCQKTENILQVVYQCEDAELANELIAELNQSEIKMEAVEDAEFALECTEDMQEIVASLDIKVLERENLSSESAKEEVEEEEVEEEEVEEETAPKELILKKSEKREKQSEKPDWIPPELRTVLCPSCGKIIAYKTCKKHIESCSRKPGDAKVRYECHHCQKTFGDKYSIRQHINKIHFHLQFEYDCKFCDETFHTRTARYGHEVDFHFGRITCSLCPKTFQRKFRLDDHIRIAHTFETPYACHLCDKKASSKTQLKKHIRTVHSTGVYTCEYCSKQFKVHKYLQQHLYTHTDEKPYGCPVCHMGFVEIRSMRKHCEKMHPEYDLPPKGSIFKTHFLQYRQARQEKFENSVKVPRIPRKNQYS